MMNHYLTINPLKLEKRMPKSLRCLNLLLLFFFFDFISSGDNGDDAKFGVSSSY